MHFICSKCNAQVKPTIRNFQLSMAHNNCIVNNDLIEFCDKCDSAVNGEFSNINFGIFLEVFHDPLNNDQQISVNELPTSISIGELNYTFLCSTIHTTGHFKCIFNINNCFYLVDDRDKKELNNKIPLKHRLSHCYYYLN